MLCQEPSGYWVQAGIISFASRCAQEDTPVLLTDTAAHSSWLQVRAQGAAFLAQNPGTPDISDEDSCVGTSSGCGEWAMWEYPGLCEDLWAAARSHNEANFSQNTELIQGPHTAKERLQGALSGVLDLNRER